MIALLKKELLELFRTKKLLILAIVFLFVAVSSPILAKLLPTLLKGLEVQGVAIKIPEPTWHDAIDQFIKNISQIAMIVVVFVFAGSIAEEKNKKTLEMLLTKPISRAKFILAKYFAALLATVAICLLTSMIFYSYSLSLFGGFSLANFLLLALLILVYLLQAISVTIFASSLTSNQIIAAGMAFFFEIVVVTILGNIDKISRYMPGYVLGHYKEIMNGSHSGFLPSVLVSIALIIFSCLAAVMTFRKQEIER